MTFFCELFLLGDFAAFFGLAVSDSTWQETAGCCGCRLEEKPVLFSTEPVLDGSEIDSGSASSNLSTKAFKCQNIVSL